MSAERPVLILAPLREEAGSLRRIESPGPTLIMVSGMGRRAGATAAAQIALLHPRAVLLAGVAGGLDPLLRVGDVVVATEARSSQGQWRAAPFPGEATRGPVFTAARILTTPEEKSTARTTGAVAVDLEAAHVADSCEREGVPWACVRAVSDPADERLPLDFNRCLDRRGQLDPGKVLLAVARQPWSVPGLLRLGRQTAAATKALGAYLSDWLPTWCAELPTE